MGIHVHQSLIAKTDRRSAVVEGKVGTGVDERSNAAKRWCDCLRLFVVLWFISGDPFNMVIPDD